LAVVAAVALTLAGCSGPAATAPATTESSGDPFEDLVAAAQSEGQLTVYGAPPEPALQAAVDAFTEKYGIAVSSVRIVGGEIAARYPAEKQAGAPTADVLLMNLASFFPQAIEEGIVTPLEDLDIPGYPWELSEEFLRPEYGTAVVGLQVRGITINTDFIDEDEIDDWDDVLDPKYTGHVGIADPGSAPVYIGHWYTVGEEYGGAEDYLTAVHEQLAPNGVFASGAPATAATGAGEVWMFPMNINGNTQQVVNEGAPLAFVVPDTTTTDEQALLVNNEPKSPNAAKLFVSYMMSEEGSTIMADVGAETSPFNTDSLPGTMLTWPLKLADEQKDNVVSWLLG
jgi:iron(III) transport system substrate-binding protein